MNVADLKLPRLMAVVCKAGGMEAVEKLADAFGGKLVYIPTRDGCPDNHLLVLAAGRAVADALCSAYGGNMLEFPRGNDTLRLYLVAGMLAEDKHTSLNQIAAALGISWRQARRLRKQVGGRTKLAKALAEIVAPRRKVGRQFDLEDWLQAGATPNKK